MTVPVVQVVALWEEGLGQLVAAMDWHKLHIRSETDQQRKAAPLLASIFLLL